MQYVRTARAGWYLCILYALCTCPARDTKQINILIVFSPKHKNNIPPAHDQVYVDTARAPNSSQCTGNNLNSIRVSRSPSCTAQYKVDMCVYRLQMYYSQWVFQTMWSPCRDIVLVGRTIDLGKPQGVGKLEWGRNGEGMGRRRSVYEQPGTRVDEDRTT